MPVVQFSDPAIGQSFGGPGIVPPEGRQYGRAAICFGQAGLTGREQFKESTGKEVTMSVANMHREEPIIIGLVSDTHGLVRNGLFSALAGVSRILHAGDVGGRHVLDALGTIAPVRAVYGNVDPLDGVLPDEIVTNAGGLSIHVSHGHEFGSPTAARLLSRYSGDILVYGHTHRALVEHDGKRLVVNPGAAGPRRFDINPSVGILRIFNGSAEVEIVQLGD